MDGLPIDFPWLYNLFQQGYYIIRATLDRALNRLSYSRVFNENCQESWGLTRGRGMTESVRLLWVLSGHKCAEVNEAKTELSGSKHKTSEQHVELDTSQLKVDILLILGRLFSGY